MFRKALIRFGVGLFLLASVTVLATASGGSAEVNFAAPVVSFSHDGASPSHDCPGFVPTVVNERHYCLVATTFTHLKKVGGVEVDLTLQNYDQSSLSNPVTHLAWAAADANANLLFQSSDGPATCLNVTPPVGSAGQVDCSFPNLPGLGSASTPVSQKACPGAPVPPSGPICSTVKLFFSVNDAAPSVSALHFTATANVKESQPNGANADAQTVAPVMVFDNDDPNTGGDNNADATVVLPQAATLLEATKSSAKFVGGSRPFLAQFQQSQLQPTTPGVCFPGIGCTGLQLTTDLAAAPTGTFSNNNPIVWTADVNATNTNVVAVHYYDAVINAITGSPTSKTFTIGNPSFANCDGVNFGSSPPGDLVANQDYFAINRATNGTNTSFQVATSATGKPLSFMGTGPFSGSCIRIIGDQKSEKISGCTSAPPPPPSAPAVPPALCAVKLTNSTVRVYLWDSANGGIHY